MRGSTSYRFVLACTLLLNASLAAAQLKPSQARKLIARAAGINLPSSAVRVKQVSVVSPVLTEATADIETAFRLEENSAGQWTIREVRVAQDRWEDLGLIAEALGTSLASMRCSTLDQIRRQSPVADERHARCLIAELLGVELPSDAVRIKSLSSMGLPFGTATSITAVARVSVTFRFSKEGGGGWQTTEVRTGNRGWAKLPQVVAAVDAIKRRNALAEMQTVATALGKFRAARGFYVTADNQRVLMDHLTPRYLTKVTRVDPWNRPYEYEGDANRFTLRCTGSDGKPNTTDDIVLSQP
jgi:hypothetical protein